MRSTIRIVGHGLFGVTESSPKERSLFLDISHPELMVRQPPRQQTADDHEKESSNPSFWLLHTRLAISDAMLEFTDLHPFLQYELETLRI